MKSILFVCEEFREDALDRAGIVHAMFRYLAQGMNFIEFGQRNRADRSPSEITEIVQSGAFVVLCDVDGPKTQAAIAALKPNQPYCFVVPIVEVEKTAKYGAVAYERALFPIELVVVRFAEYLLSVEPTTEPKL